MRIDEMMLTAYLDNELPERERQQLEVHLARSPQAQARLARLRQESAQVNEALNLLASPSQPQAPAWLALKRLRPRLNPTFEENPAPQAETPSASSWESPSLLNEVKNIFRANNWKHSLKASLFLATLVMVAGLVGIIMLFFRLPMENIARIPLQSPGLNQDEPIEKQAVEPEVLPSSSPLVTQENSTTQVIVALKPINRGAPLVPGSIGRRDWPATNLPPNFIADEDEIAGKVASFDIVQGQIIVREMLEGSSEAVQPIPSSIGYPFARGIEVDPRGDTPANVAHLKTLGFEWVKLQMDWAEVEPVQGQYNWSLWDKVIGLYAEGNINVLLTISKAPIWARPLDSDRNLIGLPQDPADYASFVAQVARRYQGQVKAIEVWQGQNVYFNVGGEGRVDPAAYVKLLEAAYPAIKAANPDISVISGGLTPTGAQQPHALDDLEYLEQMYRHGAAPYFDAMGAHLPGFANPPEALYQGGDYDSTRGYDDHRSFFFRNTLEAYRQIMLEYQDGAKSIWPTEFGWPVWRYQDERYRFAQENSPEEQAEYTARAYEMGQAWGWVGPMFLYNLDYNLTASETELANFGILGTPTYERLMAGRSTAPAGVLPQPPAPSNDQDQLLLSLAGKIYRIDSDGSNLTTLSPGPGDWSAFWSPDRQRIVFLSQKEGSNTLYLMNADGTGLIQLTDEPGILLSPQWSPDGQTLALILHQENTSNLYSLDVGERRLTRLAPNVGSVAGPAWSPDGKQLAFAAYRDERYDIYTLEVESNKLVNLTNSKDNTINWSPVWSPDGQRLAFISNRTGAANVYIMNRDGRGVTRLTDNPAGASMRFGLFWAPGGDYLAFLLAEKEIVDLYLVALESQTVTRLTNQADVDSLMLDWSPDGRRIGFLTTTDREELELHVIDVGEFKTTVVPLPKELRGPGYIDWSP